MPTSRKDWGIDEYAADFREKRSQLVELQENKPADYEGRIDALMAETTEMDREYSLMLSEQRSKEIGSAARGTQHGTGDHAETRSPGELFVSSEDYTNYARENRGRDKVSAPSKTIYLPEGLLGRGPERRALQAEYRIDRTTGGLAASFIPAPALQVPQTTERRLFLRDLVTVLPTTASTVRQTRETGTDDVANVANVAEGALKPIGTLNATTDTLPVEVIATAMDVTNQLMEDAPALAAFIDRKMLYRLKLREELQMLAGNGTSPNLKGIRTYAGVQDQAFTGSALESLGAAFGKIEARDGVPNAVVIHPTDAWSIFTHRASTSGVLDWQNPWLSPVSTVFGVPTVRTTGIEQGVALVGDFTAANLWDRQEASLQFFNQHADYALRNKALLLAEERVAVTVDRDDWFVEVALVSA